MILSDGPLQSYEEELASLKDQFTSLNIPIPDATEIKQGGLRILQETLSTARMLTKYGITPKDSYGEYQSFLEKIKSDSQLSSLSETISTKRNGRPLTFGDFVTACQGTLFYNDYETTGQVESLIASHNELNSIGLYNSKPEDEIAFLHSSSLIHTILVQGQFTPPNNADKERKILKLHRILPSAVKEGQSPFQTLDTYKKMVTNTTVVHTKGSPPTISLKTA